MLVIIYCRGLAPTMVHHLLSGAYCSSKAFLAVIAVGCSPARSKTKRLLISRENTNQSYPGTLPYAKRISYTEPYHYRICYELSSNMQQYDPSTYEIVHLSRAQGRLGQLHRAQASARSPLEIDAVH